MLEDRSVDLLYLACNRLEFTIETFTTLLMNTDWRFVNTLFVYDDGSRDGTREWLEANAERAPAPLCFTKTNFGSPVAAMVHFIETAQAPMLAKCDNDAMLPPGWLRQSLDVFERHPELELLGIEAMYPHVDDVTLPRTYTLAEFISGLGLYRRAVFAGSRPVPYQKYFGLEEWQMVQGAGLVRGWITPAIPVFLLDRCLFEPWRSLSDSYIQRGWQRPWTNYDPACTLFDWHKKSALSDAAHVESRQTDSDDRPDFKVVILSGRASNLVPCVQSVLANEPDLSPDRIIVVDDGARAEAEPQLPPVTWVEGVKPFVFARNANLGIRKAASDVILLNDDAKLTTVRGFTLLSQQVRGRGSLAVCSAGIRGVVGNPRQRACDAGEFRLEQRSLAFICAYIPRDSFERIGPLDERFVGYGFDDNDYCVRALAAKLQLGIWDGCVVDHSGELPSTFRTRPDLWSLFQQNQRLFREKWRRNP
ncbi:MAG TPA: glycosyltransferase [Blastocatellia bacterium]|nr:glycosyltransferase [Blastocatellia bacterium]